MAIKEVPERLNALHIRRGGRAALLLIAGSLIGELATVPDRTDGGVGSRALLAQEAPGSVVVRRLRSIHDPQPRIVNGVRAGGVYPTVGMLVLNGFPICSGTLIGCNTFLTAAHCVDDDPVLPAAQFSVFLQHSGYVGVSSINISPDYEFGVRSDVAVIGLATAVTGISPSIINDSEVKLPFGTVGDIVGFGGVGEPYGKGSFVGIKRRGDVLTAECDAAVPDDAHLCWDLDAPLGPPGTDSGICAGDAGAPLFADVPGVGVAVAGTASGTNADCLPDATPYDADVAFDHGWIESVADGDLGPDSCGPVPPLFGPGSDVLFERSRMEGTDTGVMFSFSVPGATTQLRLTLNGELVPWQNYDLYARFGAAPTVSPPSYDCASANYYSFETCSFASPAAGEWFILVHNPSATEGEFDLTVSLVGSPIDADGNGLVTALTDGLLVVRYLFDFTDSALVDGALGAGAERDAEEIVTFLDSVRGAFDFDDNGSVETLSDGVLLLRYLFGLRDEALVANVLGDGAERTDPDEIESYIASLL